MAPEHEPHGVASSDAMAAKFSALRGQIVPQAPAQAPAADRYVFGEVFARGGLGQVRRAFDVVLGRTVAVKEMLSPLGGERFVREAQVTARLEHPAIVPVHDLGAHADGQPFYCMRLIDGRSLDEVIAGSRSLAERIVLLPHIVTAAEAVAFAHSKGLLHRDLKPANILVGNFGETWVIDWGLTGYLESDHPPASEPQPGDPLRDRLTRTGEWLGTLPYMAPEQRRGQQVDQRADVYGLGAVLYHTLAGLRPYGDGDAPTIDRGPTDLAYLVPETPPELLAIVRKAMARTPESRYPDARALIDDLRRFLDGRLVAAHTYRAADVLRRWSRRHRGVLSVVALAFAVLVVFAAFGVRRISDARATAERNEQRATSQQRAAEAARDEAREALATLEEETARRLLETRQPLDAVAPLQRALALTPDRGYLRSMLAHARRPLDELHCEGQMPEADAVVVHPTRQLVALGSSRREQIELWDEDTCTRRHVVSPPGILRGLRFSADGAELHARTGEDGLIRYAMHPTDEPRLVSVYDQYPEESGGLAGMFTMDGADARTLQAVRDGVSVTLERCGRPARAGDVRTWRGEWHGAAAIVALDRSGDVRVWNPTDGTCMGVVSDRRVTKWRVRDDTTHRELLTLDSDLRLSIWPFDTGELALESTLNLDEGGIFDFDVVGSTLATLGIGGSLRIWRDEIVATSLRGVAARNVAIHPEGHTVAASDKLGVISTDLASGAASSWDLPELDELRWDPDGTLAARRGTQLFAWDPASAAVPEALEVGHIFAPEGLEHDAVAGTSLVVIGGAVAGQSPPYYDLRLHDRASGAWYAYNVYHHQPLVVRSAAGKDGTRMLLGNTGALIETITGELVADVNSAAVFTPDGGEILGFRTEARGLTFYDADTGRPIDSIDPDSIRPWPRWRLATAHDAYLEPNLWLRHRAAIFSPSGDLFAVQGPDFDVTLYRHNLPDAYAKLAGHRLDTYSVLWSPDEARVVTLGRDNVANLWDSETGQRVAELTSVWIGAKVVFSRASPRMALVERGGLITIVDTASGARLFVIPTTSPVDMAFAPDGRLLYVIEGTPGEAMRMRAVNLDEAQMLAG